MNFPTDLQILNRFQSGETDMEELLLPLLDLATQSPTLIVGYGVAQHRVRELMIPYFHVCSGRTGPQMVRALLVGGWSGTEDITKLTVLRLLAAMEHRLALAAGLEVTAYPVLNLEAHRAGCFLTGKQQLDGVRLWEQSPCSHVRVLENELLRYNYDVAIVLREDHHHPDMVLEMWADDSPMISVVEDALGRYVSASPGTVWTRNPARPLFSRVATPVPGNAHQPIEIVIGVSPKDPASASENAMGLVLTILHSLRHGREEGLG